MSRILQAEMQFAQGSPLTWQVKKKYCTWFCEGEHAVSGDTRLPLCDAVAWANRACTHRSESALDTLSANPFSACCGGASSGW